MKEVGQPLNLLGLAKAGAGQVAPVPGTGLEVLLLDEGRPATIATASWLAVLEGELIVDLPHGDFRILQQGDSLHLPAGLEVGFEPLKPTVVLRSVPAEQ